MKTSCRKILLPLLCCTAFLVLAGFVLHSCSLYHEPTGNGSIPEVKVLETNLKKHVYYLADTVGERNVFLDGTLEQSATYIEREFAAMGYTPVRQVFSIGNNRDFDTAAGKSVCNIEAVKKSDNPNAKTLVIGGHYDTRVGMDTWNTHGPVVKGKTGTPGANDNATGVAATLEIARALKDIPLDFHIRFVAYVNEEAPFFKTESMGSLVHAKALAKEIGAENVLGMMSMETIGCYSPRVNKKRKSAMMAGAVGLPDRCDYVAFMSTNTGKGFSRNCADIFTRHCRFPVRTAVFPYYTKGVAWSDDWSYMKQGIPSFSVTDTAYLRCDDYHETSDTADKLDYPQFAEVIQGIITMIRHMQGSE